MWTRAQTRATFVCKKSFALGVKWLQYFIINSSSSADSFHLFTSLHLRNIYLLVIFIFLLLSSLKLPCFSGYINILTISISTLSIPTISGGEIISATPHRSFIRPFLNLWTSGKPVWTKPTPPWKDKSSWKNIPVDKNLLNKTSHIKLQNTEIKSLKWYFRSPKSPFYLTFICNYIIYAWLCTKKA